MGGCTFHDAVRRKSCPGPEMVKTDRGTWQVDYIDWPKPQEAFDHLAAEDRYENGHSYSGGIGMKHDFKLIADVATITEASALADQLIEAGDPRIDDKWGPAGLITIREGDYQFLFFGWASS